MLDGERLLQQGRSEDAVRRLRDAVEYLPANAQAWNHLGLALHAARQPAEAASSYEHALRLDRNLAAAHFNLGCLRLEQGNPAAAADSLRSYVGLQPRSAPGWVRLGQAQLRLRQWEPAENSFRSALRVQGGDPEALNGLGVTFQQRRRPREAWQCFTNALGHDPRHAPAWLNLAVIAHQAGARPHAAQAYRQYAALRPDAARAMGLENLVRSLTDPPPSAVRPPAMDRTNVAPPTLPVPTNRPLPAAPPAMVGPATNRPAAATPAPRTSPVVSSNPLPGVVPTPAQPRGPPRQAAAGNAIPSEPSAPPAVSPAPEPAPTTASVPPDPVPRVAPVPSRPTNSVTAAEPVPTPGPAVAPVPSPNEIPPVAVAAEGPERSRPTEEPAAPADPPLEEVRLASEPGLATEVKDEPWNGPLPAAPGAGAATSTEPPPLIRPIAPRKAASAADKRGFWDKANPLNWFDSDAEPPAPGGKPAAGAERTPPSGTGPTPEEESDRWRWAKPGTWFRSGRNETPPPTPTRPGEPPPAARTAPRAPTGTGMVPASTSAPPVRVAVAAPPVEPAESPVRREVRRYVYRPPSPVESGDAAAARNLVAEGVQEHRRNRLDAAADRYEQALKLDPASFEAQQNLASARLQQGDLPRALEAGEAALALRPDSAPARLNFALALDRAGYAWDAAAEAEKVVGARPDDVSAHLLLGNLYSQKLDRPERARDHYLRVIELEPEHSQSIAIRRWLSGRR